MLRKILFLIFSLLLVFYNLKAQDTCDIDGFEFNCNQCQYPEVLLSVSELIQEEAMLFIDSVALEAKHGYISKNKIITYSDFEYGITRYASTFYYSSPFDYIGTDTLTLTHYYGNLEYEGSTNDPDTETYIPSTEYTVYVTVNECLDCYGDLGGLFLTDSCGNCFESPIDDTFNQLCYDCEGILNGNSIIDSCGICSVPETFNATCTDCQGTLFGQNELDECGNCLLPTDSLFNACLDCNGIVDGDFYLDACGNCVSPEDEWVNKCSPEFSKAIGDTIYYYLPYTSASEYCINTIMNDIEDCEFYYDIYNVDCAYKIEIEGGELLDENDFGWYKRLTIIIEAESVYLSQKIVGVASFSLDCSIEGDNYIQTGIEAYSCGYYGEEICTLYSYDGMVSNYIIQGELIANSNYYDCNNVLNGSSIVDTCGVCLLPQSTEFNACLDSIETSIHNIELITNIFPNPAKNYITIQQQNLATVKVFNVTGKLVFTDKARGLNQLNINCSVWQAGIYFLEAQNQNGQTTTRKIIIK